MWTLASTTDALTSMFTQVGTVMALVIAAIITTTVALLGLGFGVRHLKKYVTGKKF